ncbi:MAG: glycosyltransferase family 9 protein, partial [Proteobacteria bacterium]|nr:glycosyltransferase family 9 protein [Pseudomonadota bacterium]
LPFVAMTRLHLVDRVIPFHEAARIAMLLEPLGMSREKILAARPRIAGEQAESGPESKSQSLPGSAKAFRIAIAPGSVWGTKRWLPERFARLGVELLARVPDSRIILTGSPDEAALCDAIERKIGDRTRVENLAGKTALKELPALFAGFDLVVTNDSSPVHYAGAVNAPTVAIFGATIPQFGFAPLAQKSKVVDAGKLPCRPCSDHGPQVCPEVHFRCMKDITVEKVLEACLSLFDIPQTQRVK